MNQWSLILLTVVLFVINFIQQQRTDADLKTSRLKIDSLEQFIEHSRVSGLTKLDSLSTFCQVSIDLKEPQFAGIRSVIDSMARDSAMVLHVKDQWYFTGADLIRCLKFTDQYQAALHLLLENPEVSVSLIKSKDIQKARTTIPDCGFSFTGAQEVNRGLGRDLTIDFVPAQGKLNIHFRTKFAHRESCNGLYLSEVDLPGSVVFLYDPSSPFFHLRIEKLVFVNGAGAGLPVQLSPEGADGISLPHGVIADTSTWRKLW
jgi:hypothetical protein